MEEKFLPGSLVAPFSFLYDGVKFLGMVSIVKPIQIPGAHWTRFLVPRLHSFENTVLL